MNTLTGSWTFRAPITTLLGFILLSGLLIQATASRAETKPDAKAGSSTVYVTKFRDWSASIKEPNSEFDCTLEYPNAFLVGRYHSGDENGYTRYLCATARQFDQEITVSDKEKSKGHSEYDSDYACPKNKVMVGRNHAGDEEGTTWYFCATLTGPLGPLEVAPLDMTNPAVPENNHKLECDNNTALVRRAHARDETGYTRHGCGELY